MSFVRRVASCLVAVGLCLAMSMTGASASSGSAEREVAPASSAVGPWLFSGYYWNNDRPCLEAKITKWAQGYEVRPVESWLCYYSGHASFFSYRTP
jgi:hypothetical protein